MKHLKEIRTKISSLTDNEISAFKSFSIEGLAEKINKEIETINI